MTQPKYHSLNELINMIDEPNRTACHKIYQDNKELFDKAPGSSHNHQAWEGGYLDHMREGMNTAIILYEPLNSARKHSFSLSDALLGFYLHDLEKPWRYVNNNDGTFSTNPDLKDKEKQAGLFKKAKMIEFGFQLNSDHWNVIKYAEGEHMDYTPGKRGMKQLAAFVHMCDVWSARGWHNYPQENDPWQGSKRDI